MAKITCLAAALPAGRFATFGGQSDFIIGGLSSGSVGCIAAFANVFPKTIVRIYDLYRQGKYDEALRIHQRAALAEQQIKDGIGATKYAAAIRSATSAGIRTQRGGYSQGHRMAHQRRRPSWWFERELRSARGLKTACLFVVQGVLGLL